MLEQINGFEQSSKAYYDQEPDPQYLISGGWLALEVASHLPASPQRRSLLSRSEERFEAVADKRASSDYYERFVSYNAGLGLIALNAYQAKDIPTAIDDTPGMYSELIGDLIADKQLGEEMYYEQVGLLGELIVGATCSSMELLTLPASVRHDKPFSKEKPSFAHDLVVWCVQPTELSALPDRYLQVKVGRNWKPVGYYSKAITQLNVTNDISVNMMSSARRLSDMYDGHQLSDSEEKTIRKCQRDILDVLCRPVGRDNYVFREKVQRRKNARYS